MRRLPVVSVASYFFPSLAEPALYWLCPRGHWCQLLTDSSVTVPTSRPVAYSTGVLWGWVRPVQWCWFFPRNHQSRALLVVLGTTTPLSWILPCIYLPSLRLHLYPNDLQAMASFSPELAAPSPFCAAFDVSLETFPGFGLTVLWSVHLRVTDVSQCCKSDPLSWGWQYALPFARTETFPHELFFVQRQPRTCMGTEVLIRDTSVRCSFCFSCGSGHHGSKKKQWTPTVEAVNSQQCTGRKEQAPLSKERGTVRKNTLVTKILVKK